MQDATDRQLVGFVQADGAQALDIAALITRCGAHLASYTVPSKLYVLRDFPRTGSGKIDRTALVQLQLVQE